MFEFIKKRFRKQDDLGYILKDIVTELRNINETLNDISLRSLEQRVNEPDKVKREQYIGEDKSVFIPSINESNLSGNNMIIKSNIKENNMIDTLNTLDRLNKGE